MPASTSNPVTNVTTVRPAELAEVIKICYELRQPLMNWGPPGVGKSAIFAQVAKDLGVSLLDIRLLIRDEVDMRGVPFVENGLTRWAAPAEFPRDGKGIFLIDELPSARPGVQATAYQLVLDRCLGEYQLPDGWVVMAAGNRESDGAVSYRMPTPLRNRFLHVETAVNLEDWCRWSIGHDIHPLVVAFVRFRPDLLFQFNVNDRSFPTPRTWEKVSGVMAVTPGGPVEAAMVKGLVGEGAGTEFLSFIRMFRDLPDISGIIASPGTAVVPTAPSLLYALSSALGRMTNTANIKAVMKYLDRLPVEFEVLAVRDAVMRDPALANTAAFSAFARAHSSVVW